MNQKCASQYRHDLDELESCLSVLINKLPSLQSYIMLLPEVHTIQSTLRDLYDEYISGCMLLIRHMRGTLSPTVMVERVRVCYEQYGEDLLFKTRSINREAIVQRERKTLTPKQEDDQTGIGKNSNKKFCNIKFDKMSTFVGRADLLRQMQIFLDRTKPSASTFESYNHVNGHATRDRKELNSCVLTGLAGVGKTQIAQEHARRHTDKISVILQLPGGSEQNLQDAVSCALRTIDPLNSKQLPRTRAQEAQQFSSFLQDSGMRKLNVSLDSAKKYRARLAPHRR